MRFPNCFNNVLVVCFIIFHEVVKSVFEAMTKHAVGISWENVLTFVLLVVYFHSFLAA